MRRKIVRHGPSSLTISLPLNWLKKNGLKNGNEVKIFENNSELIIRGKGEREKKRMTLDLCERRFTTRLFVMPYIRGYDLIKIKFKSYEILERIQKNIGLMFGFEIVQEEENSCLIKNVAESKSQEFEIIFSRMFNVCTHMLDELANYIIKEDKKALEKIPLIERSMTRLDLLCRRMINLGIWGSEQKKAGSTYSIVRTLEGLGDIVTDTAKKVPKINDKNRKHLINIINKIIDAFKILKKIRYKDHPDLIFKYRDIEDELWDFRNLKSKFIKDELELFFSLEHMIFQLHEMSEEIILWNYHE